MYSQLLKEILLEDEYDEQQKKTLVNFCQDHYAGNNSELKIIDEFEQKYPEPSDIWWYTRECFLYRMVNKALRTQDIEVIMKMGFFIRGLHQHIEQFHSQQIYQRSLIVYRGQGMDQTEFEKIYSNKGGLLAFNSFLSTSIVRDVSSRFARVARDKSLSPNHPSLATIHHNMAYAFNHIHQIRKAIEHAKQAVDIGRRSLSSDHPLVQQYEQDLRELERQV
ncbi:unnamed protein product [Rotaria sp. Silwood1]|nr:unnamed protein product [Rotaria sp. Silwood1]CAF3840841.1 unnamed protein product [Rotaria sp. Silwood1]CAF4951970.1 unnamed protein product [Rotaria sp. Silwood1]CAF5113224.1 unnamed protein product [Rotaria sp. Silwood1]